MNQFYFSAKDFLSDQDCDEDALINGDFTNLFHDFYEARVAQCLTRKGARQLLAFLYNKSIDSIILSNHINGLIMTQLVRLGFNRLYSDSTW